MNRIQQTGLSSGERGSCSFFAFLQCRLPFSLAKAHQNGIVRDQQGPFHQHAVSGQQGEHLLLAHAWQAVLQLQLLVEQTAGVEETPQGQLAFLLPDPQFLRTRVFFLDGTFFIRDPLGLEPSLSLFAGAAAVIADKKIHREHSLLFLFKSIIKENRTKCNSDHIFHGKPLTKQGI